jgi:hypothetical protein
MDRVKCTSLRGDPDNAAVLWDWQSGDGYESGTEVRGKWVRTSTAAGKVEVNDRGWLVITDNGGFTVGTADTTPTSASFMPPDGAFDISKKTKVTVKYLSSAGIFNIFVNNNTTDRNNSVLGNTSRIFSRAPVSGTIEAVIDPQYMGTNTASLSTASCNSAHPQAERPRAPLPFPALPCRMKTPAHRLTRKICWFNPLK